ncbi:cyclin-dependent kinase 2-associated protein 2-like isoform X2 [Hypanus sabinus]|uniref:cyclin-dependent kinase 2-associated protein 2-like isoform X2 n=1 Tax=Hypanus sabinus TaxID=79690 RepID=UPI0028C4959C|nr:cyclin-dependent kinase 2-associated protein 2-like isoform X2 [Hypanus sabinus]
MTPLPLPGTPLTHSPSLSPDSPLTLRSLPPSLPQSRLPLLRPPASLPAPPRNGGRKRRIRIRIPEPGAGRENPDMSFKPGGSQSVISVNSPSSTLPPNSFRPVFNDFGPPSMGYMQPSQPSQSTYSDLLSVIEEMGREIRPTYAGSKSAMERLKRGIIHARALVRECLAETERNARS